jgi:hypothetical protein
MWSFIHKMLTKPPFFLGKIQIKLLNNAVFNRKVQNQKSQPIDELALLSW